MTFLGLADLECTLFEGSLEKARLTAQNDLVDIEMMRSTDDLAVREVLGVVRPSEMLAWIRTQVGPTKKLTR